MKALSFILVIALSSHTAKAQEYKLDLKKTTDKYGLNLKKETLGMPFIGPQSNLSSKKRTTQKNGWLGSAPTNHLVYPHALGRMPCVIPDTKNIARIPNALPFYASPEVAAISNPLFKNKKDIFNSSPSN